MEKATEQGERVRTVGWGLQQNLNTVARPILTDACMGGGGQWMDGRQVDW